MPRIAAGTVKEHRVRQRRHLLDVARQILAERGASVLTFGELAKRARIGRTSIYEYFATREELLIALMDEEFEDWHAQLARAVMSETTAEAQLEAFLHSHLRLVRQGKHGLSAMLSAGELSSVAGAVVAERHRQILLLLEPTMRRLVPGELSLGHALLRAVIKAAMDQVSDGRPPRTVARRTAAFLTAGLHALGD